MIFGQNSKENQIINLINFFVFKAEKLATWLYKNQNTKIF